MRSVFTLAVLAAAGSVGVAEELKNITLPTRYGISPNPEFYPQGTPKEALTTAAALMEKGRYAYLLAHVMDPAFVDAESGCVWLGICWTVSVSCSVPACSPSWYVVPITGMPLVLLAVSVTG